MADKQNALGLSDEVFMNSSPDDFIADTPAEEETSEETESLDQESEDTEESTEEPSVGDPDTDSEAQEQTTESDSDEEVSEPEGDTPTEHENSEDEGDEESLDTSNEKGDTKEDTPDNTEFDYKSAFEEVTKPFKANGVEMQVKDPQDIVRLMQMGANYNKKMAQLKPNLRLVKMLEKANLLDEAKLNNLIDISRKDPAAIAKMVKDSGVDPMEMDTDAADGYRPTDHSVSETEYELDEVLESIKDTPTFDKTIHTLTKEWDTGSRVKINDNPSIIGIINEHMENGVFDKVNEVLQHEKTLGNTGNLSDVDAYYQIAQNMLSKGLLNTQNSPATKEQPAASKVSSDQQKEEAQRKNKRKAAAPNKAARKQTKSVDDGDLLGLSDDDFMKKFAAG